MSTVAVYAAPARMPSPPVDTLEESIPYPSKFDMVRFYTECIHDYWPTPPLSAIPNPLPANLADRQAILSDMDRDIEDMEFTLSLVSSSIRRIIRKARSRRNYASASVNQLPVEVLCEIFAHADDGRIRDKLTLSHICAHWRSVALDFPFMWATIDLDSLTHSQYLTRLIQRAGSIPLELEYYDWHVLDADKADFCSRYMPNTRALKIRVGTRYMRHSGAWLADIPAPVLRRLQIAVSEGTAIFPRLFGKQAPHLTELTLINCRLAWAPDLYAGLTKLKIDSQYVMQRSDPSDGDLGRIFAECPSLEELELVNCGPVHDITSLEPRTPVPLPNLRVLRLHLHVVDINYLLDVIAAPPTAHLILQCGTSGTEPSSIVGSVAAGFAPLQQLRSLEVCGSTCMMRGFSDAAGLHEAFSLSTYGSHSWEVFDLFRTDLAAFLPLPLARLRLHALDDERALWLLERLPALTHLELTSDAPDTLYHLLLALLDGPLFCRNLQSLVLADTYLDVDAVLQIGEIARYAPRLRRVALYECRADLPSTEVVELLSQDLRVVRWFDDAIQGYDVDEEYDPTAHASETVLATEQPGS
ncbi:hypothetical protein B0H21DRAFT_821960 [Amylocystis lapponica]|nr:hypothetical protein B0H21DRAFT_821960 [Amylocystis lapponica]